MTITASMLARQGGGIHELYGEPIRVAGASVQEVVIPIPVDEDCFIRIYTITDAGMTPGSIVARFNGATQGTNISRFRGFVSTGVAHTRDLVSTAADAGMLSDVGNGAYTIHTEMQVYNRPGIDKLFKAEVTNTAGADDSKFIQVATYASHWEGSAATQWSSITMRHTGGAFLAAGTVIEVYRWVPTRQPVASGEFKRFNLSADQTTGLAATNPIKFDESQGVGAVSVDAVTNVGRITLPAGGKYHLQSGCRMDGSGNTSSMAFQWYDVTNAASIGSLGVQFSDASTIDTGDSEHVIADAYVDTKLGAIEVEMRIGPAPSGLNGIFAVSTWATVLRVDVKPTGGQAVGLHWGGDLDQDPGYPRSNDSAIGTDLPNSSSQHLSGNVVPFDCVIRTFSWVFAAAGVATVVTLDADGSDTAAVWTLTGTNGQLDTCTGAVSEVYLTKGTVVSLKFTGTLATNGTCMVLCERT